MGVDSVMTIGRLAKLAGVATSTVRYYEKRGLVTPNARSLSGYRQYGQDDLDRVRFIRSAQRMGLTLQGIQVLLDYGDGDDVECGEVRELLEHRLDRVEEQLRELDRARQALREAIGVCSSSRRRERCKVIEALRRE